MKKYRPADSPVAMVSHWLPVTDTSGDSKPAVMIPRETSPKSLNSHGAFFAA